MDAPYVGAIFIWAGTFAPQGYAFCNGQTLPIQQNQALYSIIGTYYGGDGTTNFKLPNLCGRMPLGIGQSADSAHPNPNSQNLGAFGGQSTATLSINNLPTHNHGAIFTGTGGGQQNLTIPGQTGNLNVGVTVNATSNTGQNATPSSGATGNSMLSTSSYANAKIYSPAVTTNLVPLSGVSSSVTGTASTAPQTVPYATGFTGGAVSIGNAGLSQPFSTVPPFQALNFIIALTGLYPPRN